MAHRFWTLIGTSATTVNRLQVDDRKTAAWFILISNTLSIGLHSMCTGLLVGRIWRVYTNSRTAGLEITPPEASVQKLVAPIWQGTLLYLSALVVLIALLAIESLHYWTLQAVITPFIGE